MKKIFLHIFLLIFFLFSSSVNAADTSDWYIYNSGTQTHSFSIKHPTDWKARTFDDSLQGFAPSVTPEDSFVLIKEFEGYSYDTAPEYYINENTEFVSMEDVLFSESPDLIGKKVIYKNIAENKNFSLTFLKRGFSIISISNGNESENSDFPVPEKYSGTVSDIVSTFDFTDTWHQYIDYKEGYTVIFPSVLFFENQDNGVNFFDPDNEENIIFEIMKYTDTDVESAQEESENYGESLESTETIDFHGITPAVLAEYSSAEKDDPITKIFLEKDGDVFVLTDYSRGTYYDTYLPEMLESFEFFTLDTEMSSYVYFPDVRDNHVNAPAINALTEEEIIAGYPDGTFKPDGEINRAELTKLVVAAAATPNAEYKNCFPDVNEEWFAPYICYAKSLEWVTGYADGKFKPANNINRAEAIKIVLEVLVEDMAEAADGESKYADVDYTQWYGKYFIFAEENNLLDTQHVKNNMYKPAENITRKEVAEMIYRTKNL